MTVLKDMAMVPTFVCFNEEKDRESDCYALIFIADSKPPPELCPFSNGFAILKIIVTYKIRKENRMLAMSAISYVSNTVPTIYVEQKMVGCGVHPIF